MNYKLIALDLDGTLNNDEKQITKKTRDALIAVQKQGVVVVLASGRQAPGLRRECESLELAKYHGLLLSYNGGKIIDATTSETIYEKSIPLNTAKRLIKHLADFPVTPIIDDGVDILTSDETGYKIDVECKNNNLGIKKIKSELDIDFNPVKILISAPNETLMPLINDITAPFEDELSFIMSAPFYLEATAKGVSKAASLGNICTILDIKPKEVMSFGDQQNDISMIEFAGLGVAMGNACDQLKSVADEVTLSNNEDGIAATIHKYFNI